MAYYSKMLPNPMLKPDGTLVADAQEWEQQKAYLREVAQEHMYGTWPGKAECVKAVSQTTEEVMEGKAICEHVQLAVTYGGDTFSMDIMIHRPNDGEKHPTIIANSFSHLPKFQNPYLPKVVERGYALVNFLMGDLVPDVQLGMGTQRGGGLHCDPRIHRPADLHWRVPRRQGCPVRRHLRRPL